MLDSCRNPDENRFFDALEEVSVFSDSNSGCSSDSNFVSHSTQFDVWVRNLESVDFRRSKFFDWLGLDVNKISHNDFEEVSDFEREIERTRNAVEFLSTRSSVSYMTADDSSFSENSTSKVDFVHEIENISEGMEGNMNERNREFISDISVHAEPPKRSSSSSTFSGELSPVRNTDKRVKKWWLSRLRSLTCVAENEEESCRHDSSLGTKIQRVKVHHSGRQCKELSALYFGQTIAAHKGAILTMKFSLDGRFLASAGEDRVVRVWQVMEDDRSNERDIPDMDFSSVYFTMIQLLELNPLSIGKGKSRRLKRKSNLACVVLPPKVFRVMEKPLHEFQGHTSEILDLSWSRSNYLLSSSVDKTVRLWRVGNNHCLNVFPHNDYVTCVQFNPVDENQFISGSIDGKVRIWETSVCKVVYWTEIKDIVTAVCYRPDGQGGIIGSITGSCRIYSITDLQLQLEAPILLHNKSSNKKSFGKSVTGFQFFPEDPSKVMIYCADSQIRIVQNLNITGKYKAGKSTGSFSSAHFTSDGRHIISASEDSAAHIWKCVDHVYRESSPF